MGMKEKQGDVTFLSRRAGDLRPITRDYGWRGCNCALARIDTECVARSVPMPGAIGIASILFNGFVQWPGARRRLPASVESAAARAGGRNVVLGADQVIEQWAAAADCAAPLDGAPPWAALPDGRPPEAIGGAPAGIRPAMRSSARSPRSEPP